MSNHQPSIGDLFDDGLAIDEALRLGVQDALRRHKKLGQRIATWKDGRVVVLEAAEIPIDEPARRPEQRGVRPRLTPKKKRPRAPSA